MVVNFKFDSNTKSVLIDGYSAITMTSNGVFSIGKNTNWNSFDDETGVFTTSNLTIGTLGGILKATGGVVSQATSGIDYEPPVTKGALTSNNLSVITITDGSGAVIGTGTSITINKASAAADGYLGKDDWSTFDGKLTSPMTVDGDIIIQTGSAAGALAIGSAGQVLTVSGGLPSWQDTAVGSQIIEGNTRAYVKDTGADGYFAVETEGTEKLRVTPAGYVGIGVEVPTSVLDIAGSVEVTSTDWYYLGDPTTDGTWRMGIETGDFVVQKRVSGTWETKGSFS